MTNTHINRIGCGLLIILAGLNLRPALASIAPLMDAIAAGSGISYGVAALLTTLPVLIMGIGAFTLPWLRRFAGSRQGIFYGLLLIMLACLLRLAGSNTGLLMLSAALAGIGIAVIQALVPTLIKQHFGQYTALMMGLYVTSLMGGATLAAGASPWLAAQSDWEMALALWSIPAALTAVLWLRLAPADTASTSENNVNAAQAKTQDKPIRKMPIAWLLAVYFGIGTAVYVCTLTWLPPYFVHLGYSTQQAGLMLSYMTAFEVASGLLLPVLASRFNDLRPWLLLSIAANLVGLLGISWQGTENSLLWVAVLGAGIGGLFPLTMIVTLQQLEDPQRAGDFTAFVQGIGYIMAAMAPLAAGWLRDLTASFTLSWLLLAGTVTTLLLMTLVLKPRARQAH